MQVATVSSMGMHSGERATLRHEPTGSFWIEQVGTMVPE
jgi:hypothetical protein